MGSNRAVLACTAILAAVVLVSKGTAATFGISDFAEAVTAGQTSANYQRIKLLLDGSGLENQGHSATYGNGPEGGGEFYVMWNNGGTWDVVQDDSLTNYFKTFCLEKGETFNAGTEYTVTIDANAIWGINVNASWSGDPLAAKTKILYGLYADGILDAAVNLISQQSPFQYESNEWASAVQYVIWSLEDSHTLNTTAAQSLWNWLSDVNASDAQYQPYLNNVMALNLWIPGQEYDYYGRKQSQAIYIPSPDDQTEPTPEPATLALWSVLGLLAWVGRRLRIGVWLSRL